MLTQFVVMVHVFVMKGEENVNVQHENSLLISAVLLPTDVAAEGGSSAPMHPTTSPLELLCHLLIALIQT